MQRTDVIVLGAGMVGVSAALHLQQRGRSVVLIDRRGPGEETSYGNAGLIQREGVVPYPFPRDVTLMAQLQFRRLPSPTCIGARCRPSRRGCSDTGARLRRRRWPRLPAGRGRWWSDASPNMKRCCPEAGLLGLVRRTGYMRVYRSAQALEAAFAKQRGRS